MAERGTECGPAGSDSEEERPVRVRPSDLHSDADDDLIATASSRSLPFGSGLSAVRGSSAVPSSSTGGVGAVECGSQEEWEAEEGPDTKSSTPTIVEPSLEGTKARGAGEAGTSSSASAVDLETWPAGEAAELDNVLKRCILPTVVGSELERLLDVALEWLQRLPAGEATRRPGLAVFLNTSLRTSVLRLFRDRSALDSSHHLCYNIALKVIQVAVECLRRGEFLHDALCYLNVLLDPGSSFHLRNQKRESQLVNLEPSGFARPANDWSPRYWLCDFINWFGSQGGFEETRRLLGAPGLDLLVADQLLSPWAASGPYLYEDTVRGFLWEGVERAMGLVETVTDEELAREPSAKEREQPRPVTLAMETADACRTLVQQTGSLEKAVAVEQAHLRLLLRVLRSAVFTARMSALRSLHHFINPFPHNPLQLGMSPCDLANFLEANHLVELALKANLHHAQYVEKVEKVLRDLAVKGGFGTESVGRLWEAAEGKHDVILTNVKRLIAKVAPSLDQVALEELWRRFQAQWNSGDDTVKEKLLDLIGEMVEQDHHHSLTAHFLDRVWELARDPGLPIHLLYSHALDIHLKALRAATLEPRAGTLLRAWAQRCVDVVEDAGEQAWVVPALRHLRHMCQLAPATEEAAYRIQGMSAHGLPLRQDFINNIQSDSSLVTRVTNNLEAYQSNLRGRADLKEVLREDPECWSALQDGRGHSHIDELRERLEMVRFLLLEGSFFLVRQQAEQIWAQVVVGAVFGDEERRLGFAFFADLFGKQDGVEGDLEPETARPFFLQHVLQLEPSLLNQEGLRCFRRFFLYVNARERKLSVSYPSTPALQSLDLLGDDYLWRMILDGSAGVAAGATGLFQQIYANPSDEVPFSPADLHAQVIELSFGKLKGHMDTLAYLAGADAAGDERDAEVRVQEMVGRGEKMVRVLSNLQGYISAWDRRFQQGRAELPLGIARLGRPVRALVRIHLPDPKKRLPDAFEILSHRHSSVRQLRVELARLVRTQDFTLEWEEVLEELRPDQEAAPLTGVDGEIRLVLRERLAYRSAYSASSTDGEQDDETERDSEASLPGPHLSRRHLEVQMVLDIAELAERLSASLAEGAGPARPHMQALASAAVGLLDKIPGCGQMRQTLLAEAKELRGLFVRVPSHLALYRLKLAELILLPNVSDPAQYQKEAGGFWRATKPELWLSLAEDPDFLLGASGGLRATADEILSRLLSYSLALTTRLACVGPSKGACDEASILQSFQSRLCQLLPSQGHHDLRRLLESVQDAEVDKGPLPALGTDFVERLRRKVEEELGSGRAVPELETSLNSLAFALCLCPDGLAQLSHRQLRENASWTHFLHLGLLSKVPERRELTCQFLSALFEPWILCFKNAALPSQLLRALMPGLPEQLKDGREGDRQVWNLLQRLVVLTTSSGGSETLTEAREWLEAQLAWLRAAEARVTETGMAYAVDTELEGRLMLAARLLHWPSVQGSEAVRRQLGAEWVGLVLERFLFAASMALATGATGWAVCGSALSRAAAFEFLLSLGVGSEPNLERIYTFISQLLYKDEAFNIFNIGDDYRQNWNFGVAEDLRGSRPFVGLKNAGATCYINSVLQQLFMYRPLRKAVLEADTRAVEDLVEEEAGKDSEELADPAKERKDYPLRMLKALQTTFASLSGSAKAWIVPRLLWQTFRFTGDGERIKLREQQDAVEFLGSLLDTLEEGFKELGLPAPLPSDAFRGRLANEMIGRSCPHRYSKEDPFYGAMAIDVRNRARLEESLAEYVKGDLLEGDNAYFCTKCQVKVDAVKRTAIHTLPEVLLFQLKRFDFDFDLNRAMKFNDLFRFPLKLDMEPYTARGLAKREGAGKAEGEEQEQEEQDGEELYDLRGVVVHSGVHANSGHYYSFIREDGDDGQAHWYKFDDTDVQEVEFGEAEMQQFCFGGEADGVSGIPYRRRPHWKPLQRYWNAYILVYARQRPATPQPVSALERSFTQLSLSPSSAPPHLLQLQSFVRKSNLLLLHQRIVLSPELGIFVRTLATQSSAQCVRLRMEEKPWERAMELSLRLALEYLMGTGLRLADEPSVSELKKWLTCIRFHITVPSARVRLAALDTMMLRAKGELVKPFLVDCHNDWVREVFAGFLLVLFESGWAEAVPVAEARKVLTDDLQDDADIRLGSLFLFRLQHILTAKNASHRYHAYQLLHQICGQAVHSSVLWQMGYPELILDLILVPAPGLSLPHQLQIYESLAVLLRQTKLSGPSAKPNPFAIQCTEGPHVMPQPIHDILLSNDFRLLRKFASKAGEMQMEGPHSGKDLLRFLAWDNLDVALRLVAHYIPDNLAHAFGPPRLEAKNYQEILRDLVLLEDSERSPRVRAFLIGLQSLPEERRPRHMVWHGLMSFMAQERRRDVELIQVLVEVMSREQEATALVTERPELRDQAAQTLRRVRAELASSSAYYHSGAAESSRAHSPTLRRLETLFGLSKPPTPPSPADASAGHSPNDPAALSPAQPSYVPALSRPHVPHPNDLPPPYQNP